MKDCVPYQFDVDLVQKIKPTLQFVSVSMLICSLILDLAIFKWRWLADYIIYIEGCQGLVAIMIPSKENHLTEMQIATSMVVSLIICYTDSRF